MAKYHENLKYNEDTEEKHTLTADEVKFLLELQKEMNTQDHVSQADPRFWVIKGTEKEYGIETGYEDGAELVEIDGDTVATDMESAMVYIRDNLLDEINETDGIQRKIEFKKGFYTTIKISWVDDYDDEDNEEFENMEEVAEWLRDHGYDYRVENYRIVSKIYPNTMFLTQKAAEEHLKANDYHYSEDAHTYAMTSWRNYETEVLWKILQKVDWEALFNPMCENKLFEEVLNYFNEQYKLEIENPNNDGFMTIKKNGKILGCFNSDGYNLLFNLSRLCDVLTEN